MKLSSVLVKGVKHQQFQHYGLYTTPSQILDHRSLDADCPATINTPLLFQIVPQNINP